MQYRNHFPNDDNERIRPIRLDAGVCFGTIFEGCRLSFKVSDRPYTESPFAAAARRQSGSSRHCFN